MSPHAHGHNVPTCHSFSHSRGGIDSCSDSYSDSHSDSQPFWWGNGWGGVSGDNPSLHMIRSKTMAGKHEEFWKQGDFGYVKKEMDSMMTLCKPKKTVGKNAHFSCRKNAHFSSRTLCHNWTYRAIPVLPVQKTWGTVKRRICTLTSGGLKRWQKQKDVIPGNGGHLL